MVHRGGGLGDFNWVGRTRLLWVTFDRCSQMIEASLKRIRLLDWQFITRLAALIPGNHQRQCAASALHVHPDQTQQVPKPRRTWLGRLHKWLKMIFIHNKMCVQVRGSVTEGANSQTIEHEKIRKNKIGYNIKHHIRMDHVATSRVSASKHTLSTTNLFTFAFLLPKSTGQFQFDTQSKGSLLQKLFEWFEMMNEVNENDHDATERY